MRRSQGFEVDIVFPGDEQWGYVEEVNGTWTGMVGDVVEGRADLMTSCSLSATRLKVRKLAALPAVPKT